jgi:hypothetical protein
VAVDNLLTNTAGAAEAAADGAAGGLLREMLPFLRGGMGLG